MNRRVRLAHQGISVTNDNNNSIKHALMQHMPCQGISVSNDNNNPIKCDWMQRMPCQGILGSNNNSKRRALSQSNAIQTLNTRQIAILFTACQLTRLTRLQGFPALCERSPTHCNPQRDCEDIESRERKSCLRELLSSRDIGLDFEQGCYATR